MPDPFHPSGELPGPDLVAFSPGALLEELATLVSAKAEPKGVSFRTFVDDDLPAFISGDPVRLREVLTHLLGNAVKFTETGEVRLDVRVACGPAAGLVLRFTVMDTGAGIVRGACPGILDRPGLAASRQAVRLLGGDLHVHSNPGEGCTFWFSARFAPAAATETPPPPIQAQPFRPLRILIAEDNPVNRLVLAEQLAYLGHTSATVSNGQEALAALEGSAWDAILLDCQMPVLDGYGTIAAIRAREAAGACRVWAVGVTANALDGQREACLSAGMDDFLLKPFQFQQLARVIACIPEPVDGSHEPVDASRLDALAKSKASGGGNLLEKMASLFTDSGHEMLDQMDQALREDDLPGALRAVHKLRGGCMYLGARDLESICGEAERIGLGGAAAVRSIAPRIRQEFARVEAALRRHLPSP